MKSILETVKNKKGIAGLEILLGVVVSLFLVGMVVMIFVIMGDGLLNQTANTSKAYTVIQTTQDAMATVPNNFGLIILITVMVVLILLTVVIIRALRSAESTAGATG